MLAITGDATKLEVKYNETVVEMFLRAGEHFSAWHNHIRMLTLWNALRIDHEILGQPCRVKQAWLCDVRYPCDPAG